MNLRALIVDDEPLARERIRLLLRDEPDIDVYNEHSNAAAALADINQCTPDVLFLDVQLPGTDGFGLLRGLPGGRLPLVVFITAHYQYAVRAFEARAVDYLLKPFQPERFKLALQRVREHFVQQGSSPAEHDARATPGATPARKARLTRLPVKSGNRTIILRLEEIDAFETAGNYIAVHVAKETHIIRETLRSLETQLDPEKFLRISRTTIVNIDRVTELQPMFCGENVMVLHNGKRFTSTRGVREMERILRFS